MEEALKMRNLLQEFLKKHDGVRFPTILGLREHIFTGRCAASCLISSVLLPCYPLIVLLLQFIQLTDILLFDAVFLLLHGSCQIKRLALLLLVRDYWRTH